MNNEFPQTLVDAIRYFSNSQVAFDFMVKLRWPDGVKCSRCQRSESTILLPSLACHQRSSSVRG